MSDFDWTLAALGFNGGMLVVISWKLSDIRDLLKRRDR